MPLTGLGQFTDNFSDGDISANPGWVGGSADFIVNSSFQLQSNNITTSTSFYLSTPSTMATMAQWEWYCRLGFNTSSSNYADIFLISSAADLSTTSTTGYFVRVGNTDDEICLYRKSSAGIITKIIDGLNGVTNSADNTLKIKVTRDGAGNWSLYRDITGTGNAYVPEGSVTDLTYSNAAFFGILVRQGTAGFFQRHFFDDIEVKHFVPDLMAPVVQKVTPFSNTGVDVLFDEALDPASSQHPVNYWADNGLGIPVNAVLDTVNSSLVHLTFSGNFSGNVNYQLTVNGVKDYSGNEIVNGTANFFYVAPYLARRLDVLIDEIMVDPSPVVGLPNNEWIELKNVSTSSINLKGWRIGDLNGQSGPFPDFILPPDSFVIICAAGNLAAMSAYGPAIAINRFPLLDNTGDQLFLLSAQNNFIHSVSYVDSWYQNTLKKSGGWTLEMIDTKNPCSGFSNWKASTDSRGGSPAKKNSADGLNPDQASPRLLHAYPTDSVNLVLVFDEPLDSMKAATASNYTISDGIGIPQFALPLTPSFERVALRLGTPLSANKVYTVSVAALEDCMGNGIATNTIAKTGLPTIAVVSEIVINEILFNPPPAGYDYVELYNRSNKIIDLSKTYIANRNSSGAISNITRLSEETRLLFPQDYMVVTENSAWVKSNYITLNRDAFAIINMPSFNDDKGTVVILTERGEVTDELAYSDKWHFKLVDNKEGVALERIDYNVSTQLQNNWHSAATSAGYGTPGYKNSQYRLNAAAHDWLKLAPEIISPDNDGLDDFAGIIYNFPEAGYVANLTIFDATGRPVRYLQRNALCGTSGSFTWDGMGEKNQRLATGVYVVYTEIFNLKGHVKQFKLPVVLARHN